MAKFFVTNNSAWYDKLKENMKVSPFEMMGDFQCDGIYGLTARKLQVNNQNILIEGRDVIIQTGTCVYKEEHGLPALTAALHDFDGDVQNHRENYLGNYGCFIKKKDQIVIFNDGCGFYDVFYYNKDGKWLIGTSLIDIARVLNGQISVNKLNVLEELMRFAIFDNGTYFSEISRLSGEYYLNINETGIIVGHLDLFINQDNPTDADSRAKQIANDMKYIASVMYKNFGQTALGCTGGMDSRMVLAAYLSCGGKPKLTYGYGNSYVATSMLGDLEIDKLFQKRYGLELEVTPRNDTMPLDKLWGEHIRKYGKMIYDGCEDTFNYYTNPEEPFVSVGNMSEIYREFDWSKDIPENEMTLEKYLWGFHAAITNKNLIHNCPQVVEQWLNKWGELNKEHGVIGEVFRKEELFWIGMAYRYSADNHLVNLVNQFKYTHYLMSEIMLMRNNYLDYEYKYNGKFMLRILNKLYPDILKVPFFTHRHKMKYNPKTMEVEELKSNEIRTLINPILRKIIPSRLRKRINESFKRGYDPAFINNVRAILDKDGNEQKLRRLIGDDLFSKIDLNVEYIFVIRGIILCKTFDWIGVKY